MIFFIFDVNSPFNFQSFFTSIIKDSLPADARVSYLNRCSFEDKIKILRDGVFDFVIPYLLFLFTPIKFFKKNGDKFNFHYLLNDNNDYFKFDFIEVKNYEFFFQKDGERLDVNFNTELSLRYRHLIEYFSKNNILTLIFVAWYSKVMSDEDKKKYIGSGTYIENLYNFLIKMNSKNIKNFNSLISIVEGENTPMSKQNIFNIVKKCLKIFACLNSNVIWSPNDVDKKEEKPQTQSDSENHLQNNFINTEDKLLIDLLFNKLKESWTEPIVQIIQKECAKFRTWVAEDIKIKNCAEKFTEFLQENKDDLANGLKNVKKTNRFLDDLRFRLVYFYCFWNYNENISFNFSAGGDFSPKKKKITVLVGLGVDVKNLSFLTNFYIDSVFLSVFAYELDFGAKDPTYNGISCLVFPSFLSLKNFKLFIGIRLHEHISFSIGAAYIHKQKQSL